MVGVATTVEERFGSISYMVTLNKFQIDEIFTFKKRN